jgi:hypothetical protein
MTHYRVAASKRFPLLAAKLHAPIADYATSCGEILRNTPPPLTVGRIRGWGTWIRTRINGVRVLYSYQTSIQLHDTPLRSDSRAARARRPRALCASRLRSCHARAHRRRKERVRKLMKVPLPVGMPRAESSRKYVASHKRLHLIENRLDVAAVGLQRQHQRGDPGSLQA